MFNFFKRSKTPKLEIEDYLVSAFETFESGNYFESIRQFEAIGMVEIYHPIAHLMAARSHIELGNYEKAIDAIFRHLKVEPDSVEALIYLGLTYYECGELEQAVERYEQALKLRAESVMLRENLAIAHITAGELDEALDSLLKLHNDTPEDPSITEMLVLVLGRMGKWDIAKQYSCKLPGISLNTVNDLQKY